MKINRISAYQVNLPLHEGSYNWSGGKSVTIFDSTIVRIDTDEGLTGWAEVCPLGPFYLPAYAEGVRAGLRELAPHLIGHDPTRIMPINKLMDSALKGHPYVKSGIDIACWDILGKHSGRALLRRFAQERGLAQDEAALDRILGAVKEMHPRQARAEFDQLRKQVEHYNATCLGVPEEALERLFAEHG